MSRGITAALETETLAPVLRPAAFVEAETANNTVRFWTGYGSVDWNGETWTGAGALLGISPPEETSSLEASGLTISLSGIPSDLVALTLGELDRENLACRVWLGALDDSGAIIADPYKFHDGFVDVPEIVDDGSTATISITVESRLIALERAPDLNYTTESQGIDYPGDKGFDFVPAIQDIKINWGPGKNEG